MTPPKPLFDTNALRLRRLRAKRLGFADFLHREAKLEIQEKLIDVNRSFRAPLIITDFAEIWAQTSPGASVSELREVYELAPGSHDLIIHAMGLHHVNDPVGQIIQARRALKPDGLFLAVLFGGETLKELRASLAEAEIAVTGGLSPRVAPMAEIRDLGALLQRAGLALPVADRCLRTVSYPGFRALLHDLRAMGETNIMAERLRKFSPRRLFERAETHYLEQFSDPEGRLCASFEFVFLSGWAPSETQPKPLRPGSASRRLADALGTKELGLDHMPVLGSED